MANPFLDGTVIGGVTYDYKDPNLTQVVEQQSAEIGTLKTDINGQIAYNDILNVQNLPKVPGATDSTCLGLRREGTKIILDGGGINSTIYLKLSGPTAQRTYQSSTARNFIDPIKLVSGMDYAVKVRHLDGNQSALPHISVYEQGTATSIGDVTTDTEEEFERKFVYNGVPVHIVAFIQGGATYENASYEVILVAKENLINKVEDLSDELQENESRIESAVSIQEKVPLHYEIAVRKRYLNYSTGEIGEEESVNWGVSDYIPVDAFNVIYFKRTQHTVISPLIGTAFYDEDKVYISGIRGKEKGGYVGYEVNLYTTEVPRRAKYARFSIAMDEQTYGKFELYGSSEIFKLKQTVNDSSAYLYATPSLGDIIFCENAVKDSPCRIEYSLSPIQAGEGTPARDNVRPFTMREQYPLCVEETLPIVCPIGETEKSLNGITVKYLGFGCFRCYGKSTAKTTITFNTHPYKMNGHAMLNNDAIADIQVNFDVSAWYLNAINREISSSSLNSIVPLTVFSVIVPAANTTVDVSFRPISMTHGKTYSIVPLSDEICEGHLSIGISGEIKQTILYEMYTFTGDEAFTKSSSYSTEDEACFSCDTLTSLYQPDVDGIWVKCSHFRGVSRDYINTAGNRVGDLVSIWNGPGDKGRFVFFIPESVRSTVEEFKAYLKEQYDNGTPVQCLHIIHDREITDTNLKNQAILLPAKECFVIPADMTIAGEMSNQVNPSEFAYAVVDTTSYIVKVIDATIEDRNELINKVEPYFIDESLSTVESVRELLTEPSIVFPLFTDLHYGVTGTGGNRFQFDKTINNMRYVSEKIVPDFIVALGDMTEGNSDITTKPYMRHVIEEVKKLDIPFYLAIGNHDDNRYATKFTSEEMYELYQTDITRRTHFNPLTNGRDYYVDYPEYNVRLIALDSNTVGAYGFDSSTPTWFANVALDTPDGCLAVVVVHESPVPSQNYGGANLNNSARITSAIQDYIDSGKQVVQFYGHSHCDTSYLSPYLSIGVNCAKFENSNGDQSQWPSGAVKPLRTAGTHTEDSWDVVVIRLISKEVNCVRFGAGVDRYFHMEEFSPGTLLSRFTGSVTWSSSDSSIATVSDGTVSGVSSGSCTITATDESGNYECWKVVVQIGE